MSPREPGRLAYRRETASLHVFEIGGSGFAIAILPDTAAGLADARRIVACWNAHLGEDTAEIEGMVK